MRRPISSAVLALLLISGCEAPDSLPSSAALTTALYQINCGGGAVSPFAADSLVSGGQTFSTSTTVATAGIANAAPAAVYQSERYGNYTYTLGGLTANATYTARLHFAETKFTAAGKRVFHMVINGTQVLTNFDIFAAGGANTAVVRDFTTTATASGQIVIQFVTVTDNAKSSGIEILSVSSSVPQTLTQLIVAPSTAEVAVHGTQTFTVSALDQLGQPMVTPPPITWTATGGTINSGGLFTAGGASGTFAVTATSGSVSGSAAVTVTAASNALYQINCGGGAVSPFVADEFSSGGGVATYNNVVSTAGVANAAPAVVYQSERWGNHSYILGGLTANVAYTVRLHFAEIYWNAAGARVFNVLINGTQVLTNLDIFALVGANHALVRDFPATASAAGQITIQYAGVVDNAKSSAIEILGGGTVAPNQPPTVAQAVANPNSVTGTSTALSVSASDDAGEANLIYTWAASGVVFSPNGTNAAKNSTATFSQSGSYPISVTVRDSGGLSATSTVTANVTLPSGTVSYSTNFDGTEAPISEGGAWHRANNSWTPVNTANGVAFGTQTGTHGFDDSYAYLSGFPPDQTVSAVIHLDPNLNPGTTREVEILLRWSDAGGAPRGYECNLAFDGSYQDIERWNGKGTLAADDFTEVQITGTGKSVNDGDVYSAQIVGNVITTFLNGHEIQHVDVTGISGPVWSSGSPGMGFWRGPGGNPATPGDYGFTSYSATSVVSAPPPSGIAWVQTKNGGTGASSASFDAAQTAGNLNVVAVGWADGTSTVASVSDSRGNVYALAAPMMTVGGLPTLRQAIYYAKNIAAGSNTISVAFNGTPFFPDLRVVEYSGADSTAPFDVTATATGSGAGGSASSGSAITSAAGELIFGAGMTTDIYTGAGASFTQRIITSDGNIAEDRIAGTAGSYSASANLSGASQSWILQMATFKARPTN